MKVYRVVSERDGVTVRIAGAGKTETEILREEYRYAAESIEDVWKAIEYQRNDPEMTVIAIIEEHPAITVLAP
jgi:hypothetical protein